MTKKNVLFFSAIIGGGIAILEYLGTYVACDYFIANGHKGNCPFILSDIEAIFLPLFPLFLFSLITYKMREEVFQSWFRFARVYIPASMLLILLAPSYSSNWMFPYDKGRAAFLFSSLFIIISIVKIVLANRRLK